METRYQTEKLTDEIRKLGLNNGAELVGFTSAERIERDAPEGHRPSDLMPNAKSVIVLACGRKLNEDREYVYKWGPNFSLTHIKLKDEIGRGGSEEFSDRKRIQSRHRDARLVRHLILQNGQLPSWTGRLRKRKLRRPSPPRPPQRINLHRHRRQTEA
jgi:hypothetical protein